MAIRNVVADILSRFSDERKKTICDWHLITATQKENTSQYVQALLRQNLKTSTMDNLYKEICDLYFGYQDECVADVNYIARWAHLPLLCSTDFGIAKEQLMNPCFVFNFHEDIVGESIVCYNGFTIVNNKELYSLLSRPIIVYHDNLNDCIDSIIKAIKIHYNIK